MISFGFFRRNLLRRTLKYSIFSHSFWFPSFSLLVLPFRSPIYVICAIIPIKFKKWLNCDSQFSIICTVKFRPFLYYSFSPFRSLSLSRLFMLTNSAKQKLQCLYRLFTLCCFLGTLPVFMLLFRNFVALFSPFRWYRSRTVSTSIPITIHWPAYISSFKYPFTCSNSLHHFTRAQYFFSFLWFDLFLNL